jgi:ankyrin repeat protein
MTHGAIPDVLDGIKNTPATYAEHANHAETLDLLLGKESKKRVVSFAKMIIEPLFTTMMLKLGQVKLDIPEYWDEENHRYMTVGEFNVAQNPDRVLPVPTLHEHAHDGKTELCAVLLKHGAANVHERSFIDGTTALHKTAENNQFETCLHLLENRADVNALDFHGRTPLDCAAVSGPLCCSLLARYGGHFTPNAFLALNRPLPDDMRNELKKRLGSLITQVLYIPSGKLPHAHPSNESMQTSGNQKTLTSFAQTCNSFMQDPLGRRPNTPFRRIITLFACMKKLGWPRDIQLLLPTLDNDLMADVFETLMPRLEKGLRNGVLASFMSPVPLSWRPHIVNRLYNNTLSELDHVLLETKRSLIDEDKDETDEFMNAIILKLANLDEKVKRMLTEHILDQKGNPEAFERLRPALYQNIEILLGYHPWISHAINWN